MLLGALAGRAGVRRKHGWRLIWGCSVPLGIAAIAAILRLPDTPRSIFRRAQALALGGRPRSSLVPREEVAADDRRRLEALLGAARVEAEQAACRFRGLEAVDRALAEELQEIQEAALADVLGDDTASSSSAPAVPAGQGPRGEREFELSLAEVLASPAHRGALLVGAMVSTLPAMCGQEALFHYAPQTFGLVGFDPGAGGADLTVVLYFVKLAAALPSYLWLDQLGRRPLVAGGLTAVCGSYLGALGAMQLRPHKGGRSAAAGLSLLGGALAYQVAVGPVSWIVPAEIYPSNMRTLGLTLSSVAYSATTLVVVQMHPLMVRAGPACCFGTCAAASLGSLLVTRALLPETHGHSLEEIQAEVLSGRIFQRGSMLGVPSALGLGEAPAAGRAAGARRPGSLD
ncbi:unnamed protein product [Prorocentrum cordatum]|uniref:Major facilitator superfamily (MFS) profile domain-containing protein n=1 Tax=Prorocentrum cordatum TaxID=2364126 RepID=A0ABN9YFM8_9DINO|nr:unnamed protein product [Polarella glacialis]